MLQRILNWLLSFWITPVKEAQREYRKDRCLNKYSPEDWRDEIFW